MTTFHFLRPWAFLGLIPLIALLLTISQYRGALQGWIEICDAKLLEQLRVAGGKKTKHLSLTIFFLTGLVFITALAGPTWSRLPQPVVKQQQARVIVLDLSQAMLGEDIKPSRLARAKFQIKDLLKSPDIGQVGMVVFTSHAFLVSPLTDDAKTIASMLDELSPQMMPVNGSNIAEGLDKAQTLIHQAGYAKGQVLLFTANKAPSRAVNAAKKLKASGIDVNVIGMASKLGAPIPTATQFVRSSQTIITKLDASSLQALADAGGGKFIPFVSNSHQIDALLKQQTAAQFKRNKDNKIDTWQDNGRLLLLLTLPLLLVFFRRGWLESIK